MNSNLVKLGAIELRPIVSLNIAPAKRIAGQAPRVTSGVARGR